MKYLFPILALLFLPFVARAESLSLTLSHDTVEVGDQVAITISSATEAMVNTIDGRLILPSGVEIVGMETRLSPIQFWVESPMDAKHETIRFTGFSTNGFSGAQPLFTLILRAKTTGAVPFRAEDLSLYLHDGLGTPLAFNAIESKLTITTRNETTEPIILKPVDEIPPTVTTEIVTDRSSGKPISYLLIYGQDKETAIRSYELIDRSQLTQIETPFELDPGLFTEKKELIVTDLAMNKTRISIYIPGRIEIAGVHPTLFQAMIALALVALGAFTLTHILEIRLNAKSRVWPWT